MRGVFLDGRFGQEHLQLEAFCTLASKFDPTVKGLPYHLYKVGQTLEIALVDENKAYKILQLDNLLHRQMAVLFFYEGLKV